MAEGIEERRYRYGSPRTTGVSTGPMGGSTTPTPIVPPTDTTAEDNAFIETLFNKITTGLNGPTTTINSGGTGGSNKTGIARSAIQSLQQQLAGPSQYSGLNDRLASIYSDAEKRIRESGSGLGTYLSTPTGYTPQMAQPMATPSVAMSNYLNAIGGSTTDVNAQRALTDAAMAQIASSNNAFSGAMTQSNQDIRNALAGAVPANVSSGLSQAALNRAAMEASIAQADFGRKKTIQDQILELALQYGIKL